MPLLSTRLDKWFWFFCFFIMSAYVLYEHATSCLAVDMTTLIERHNRLIEGNSEFFNPWQYRIFSAFLLEGLARVIDLVSPSLPTSLPFLLLRFIQNLLLFYLSWKFYRQMGIQNPVILFLGLSILCYCVSNSVFQSDLSFNTYFDVIFYLLAAIIILNKAYGWIIPLTVLAALNRETSGFIPLMAAVFFVGDGIKMPPRNVLIITIVSLVLFAVVFVGIRGYYGYRPAVGIHNMTSPLDYFLFNIKFFRMYPQLFGTLGLIPLIVIFKLKSLPPFLQKWFWLIVPFWFLIHTVKSTAMETRLFLVPMALIFVPGILWLAENWDRKKSAGYQSTIPSENYK